MQEDKYVLRKCIQIVDRIVNLIVAIICTLLLLYGVYGLWDSAQINKQADASKYETYKPTDELSFAELQKLNPEVFGWLTVEGTHIDYPLVQGKDNSKYVNTDVKGEFSLSGSLFLDYRNKKDFSDRNNIIYGHHMEKNLMFGELELFQEERYFNHHRYGKLYYSGMWHEIEFFAFLHIDAYNSIIYDTEMNADEQQDYLNYVKEHAQQYREQSFDENDRYIVLSTCTSSSTNGRHVLIGCMKE